MDARGQSRDRGRCSPSFPCAFAVVQSCCVPPRCNRVCEHGFSVCSQRPDAARSETSCSAPRPVTPAGALRRDCEHVLIHIWLCPFNYPPLVLTTSSCNPEGLLPRFDGDPPVVRVVPRSDLAT